MKFLTAVLVFFFCSFSFSQKLVVVRGQAKVDSKNIFAGTVVKLSGPNRIELLKGARAVFYAGAKKIELHAIETTVYTLQDLTSRLAKLNQEWNRFDKFVEQTYKEAKKRESNVGAVAGGSEGLDQINPEIQKRDNGDILYPLDSVVILGSSVKLEWELKKSLTKPKLIVINKQTGATIKEQAILNKGDYTLELPDEGMYEWKLYSALESKTVKGGCLFKKSAAETTDLQQQLDDYIAGLGEFSPELQYLLLSDYKKQNKIVEP